MANDLNQCQFIGRLGRDPEVRYGADGAGICNFTIACGWKTKEKEGTEWVRIVAFGKLAEICSEYLKKGKQVFVSGRMRTREYEKDGAKHYVTEVVADTMQMLGGRSDASTPAGGQSSTSSAGDYRAAREGRQQRQQAPGAPAADGGLADMDDDIPF